MSVSDDLAILAVADGVGSAPHSHLGSRVAVDSALKMSRLQDLQRMVATGVEPIPSLIDLSEIANQIELAATQVSQQPTALSSTLSVAVVGVEPVQYREGELGYMAALCQLGDSGFARIRNGVVSMLNHPNPDRESAVLETATEALPGSVSALVWAEMLSPGDTLLVMSDGVINPLKANPDFRGGMAEIWRDGPPPPSTLLAVMDATIKTFDDDRTLVGIQLADDHV